MQAMVMAIVMVNASNSNGNGNSQPVTAITTTCVAPSQTHITHIWVSFCRTGKNAVLCLVFEEEKVEDY